MILLVNVNNTETSIAIQRGERLSRRLRLESRIGPTPDQWGIAIERLVRAAGAAPGAFRGGLLASVVPPLNDTILEAVRLYLGVELRRLPRAEELGVELLVDEPASVGEDRIANTVAVARVHRRDTIVVDLGTATTFDVIGAEGHFLGGVIAPGVRTAVEGLFRRTALLPRVEILAPRRVIGRTTAECIQAGVFTGTVAMIEGVVQRIRAEWGREDVFVVATGGLSGLFRGATPAVHEVDELLTLKGLAEAWKVAAARAEARPGSSP